MAGVAVSQIWSTTEKRAAPMLRMRGRKDVPIPKPIKTSPGMGITYEKSITFSVQRHGEGRAVPL